MMGDLLTDGNRHLSSCTVLKHSINLSIFEIIFQYLQKLDISHKKAMQSRELEKKDLEIEVLKEEALYLKEKRAMLKKGIF